MTPLQKQAILRLKTLNHQLSEIGSGYCNARTLEEIKPHNDNVIAESTRRGKLEQESKELLEALLSEPDH